MKRIFGLFFKTLIVCLFVHHNFSFGRVFGPDISCDEHGNCVKNPGLVPKIFGAEGKVVHPGKNDYEAGKEAGRKEAHRQEEQQYQEEEEQPYQNEQEKERYSRRQRTIR